MSEKKPRQTISGVFSRTKASTIGAGTTARKTETVAYFYAKEREDGVLEVQALGDQVVFGPVDQVSLDEFLAEYMPEPQMSQERARAEATRQGKVQKAVARGDKLFKQGKKYSAEYEYGQALALDEESVRANFGIGQCFIARGDTDKAREVFERLLKLDAAFQDQHKHLFNEFGIALRKSGMFAEALAYYGRAVELCPDDENLHYNMGRAFFELGDTKAAAQRLAHCLLLNPGHGEAKRFMTFIKRAKPLGG
jgi:tetratricopeptide (TPR) repeat protein